MYGRGGRGGLGLATGGRTLYMPPERSCPGTLIDAIQASCQMGGTAVIALFGHPLKYVAFHHVNLRYF